MLRSSESRTAETYAFVFFPIIIIASLIFFAATTSIAAVVSAAGALLGLSVVWRRREQKELVSLFTLASASALFAGLSWMGASEIILMAGDSGQELHLSSAIGFCFVPGLLLVAAGIALYRYDLRQQSGK